MKRAGRILFNVATALSLVLCVALCILSIPTGDGVPTVELLRVPRKDGHFMVDSTRMGVSAYVSDSKSSNNFVLKKALGVRVFDVPLDNYIEGINTSLRQLDEQYTDMRARVDAKVEYYRAQFTQLDLLVSRMNSTSSYLTQQFASMSGSSDK